MPATLDATRLPYRDDAVPKLELRAYLAGLGAAATLIVGATIIVSLGMNLVFG